MARNRKGPSRVDEEELCAECFRRLLADRLGRADVDFERGKDPPDFVFTIGGRRFPVEVTSLVESVDRNGESESIIGVQAEFRKFAQNVEKEAVRAGYHDGLYVIQCGARADVRKDRRRLVSLAVDFVRQTQSVREKAEQELVGGKHAERVHICRLSSGALCIGPVTVGAKWSADSDAEVRQAVKTCIDAKNKALRRISQRDKLILILYDAYLYADVQGIRRAAEALKSEESFHSIVCVRGKKTRPGDMPDGECWVLASAEPSWRDRESCGG